MSEYTDSELEMRKEIKRLRKVIKEQDENISQNDIMLSSIYNFVKKQLILNKEIIDIEKERTLKRSTYFTSLGTYNVLKEIMNLLNK